MKIGNDMARIQKLTADLVEARKGDDEDLIESLEIELEELRDEMEAIELDEYDENHHKRWR